MPATFQTQEYFERSMTTSDMDEQVRLRIKAGAIRSNYSDLSDKWLLETEWNVIGEQ